MVFPYYPRPEDDEGYVKPGKPHTLPSGPTTHSDPPIPNDIVTFVPPSTISGPGNVTPGEQHTLPGGSTAHQDPPIPNDIVTLVPPSSDMPPSNNSNFNPLLNKETAIAHNERARREREDARNVQSQSDVQVIPVIPADLARDFAPEIVSEEPAAREDWRESTPLTPGQAQQVDHLLTVETDSLAREVLITLKRDGLPPKGEWNNFMAQYALFSWDTESDAQAWATLALIAESDWDEATAYADEDHVEAVAQDRANDWIEGLTIIHAGTGDILLDVTGVVRADGSQYVGLQDYEAEALKGLPVIFVHNHTKEVGASDEDLESAFDAGAEMLIVITPSGREQVFVRGRGRMVLVRDERASYEMISTTREEAIELAAQVGGAGAEVSG